MRTYGKSRRVAKIRLGSRELERLVDLPEGLHVVGIHTVPDPVQVLLLVEGEALPEVPPDAEAPFLDGDLVETRAVDRRGDLWSRWSWRLGKVFSV